MSVNYALEKLHSTERALALLPGRIKERLIVATSTDFVLVQTVVSALPDELRALYEDILNRITSIEGEAGEGSLAATINRMDEDTAVGIAREITELTAQLDMHQQYPDD